MDASNGNPTPELKSSPVIISFIPFNNNDDMCTCGNGYFTTLLFQQKYCKSCLSLYIKNTTDDNNIYLDIHISTRDTTQCIEHEATRKTGFYTRNIQEWCEYCSEILYFKQIVTKDLLYIYNNEQIDIEFRLFSDSYIISSGSIESALTNKDISILYLPWWDTYDQCIVCNQSLKFVSTCQKWCLHCYLIYTGCRFCLTTNIIFGIAKQSQCRKCEKISIINIDIANINSEDINIEEFLISLRLNDSYQIANDIDESSNPLDVYNFIPKKIASKPVMEWIPHSQIINYNQIAEGGFGIIYKATWLDGVRCQHDDFLSIRDKNKFVAIKRFSNSQNISKYFLNELKSLYQCHSKCDRIISYYGITRDPKTKEFMLIMKYASGGNLHNYLQKNFTDITWYKKLYILWQISDGLYNIHRENFIHRDFHSGNILLEIESEGKWQICDLGLSQPANSDSTTLNNDEIYGVIPYIAPEIFNGASFSSFSKASDIYSMGMIMWELTSGCKPFANVEHNTDLIMRIVDGERPEITNDTPKQYADLMERCWDSDPAKRPSAKVICETIYDWSFRGKNSEEFNQAEEKRVRLIRSMILGPEFSEKPHSKAIFTSRPLSFFISKSCMIPFDMNQEYITKEFDFDVDM